MTEPQEPTGGQEPQTGQGQEPTKPQAEPQEPQTGQGAQEPAGQEPAEPQEPEGMSDLPEWAQKQIRDLRTESADRRTKLKEFEDRDKTEAQKAADERDTLKTENEALRQTARRSAFLESIQLPSPKLAWNSLSDAGVELKYDDQGRPQKQSLEAARKQLKEYDPEVFGVSPDGSADGGSRGSGSEPQDMNAQIRAAAGRG